MKSLPDHLSAFKRTETFTNETIPEGILNDHKTGFGVWALIHVEAGRLEYIIADGETVTLSPAKPGVIEPMVAHRVKPLGEVKFFLELYK